MCVSLPFVCICFLYFFCLSVCTSVCQCLPFICISFRSLFCLSVCPSVCQILSTFNNNFVRVHSITPFCYLLIKSKLSNPNSFSNLKKIADNFSFLLFSLLEKKTFFDLFSISISRRENPSKVLLYLNQYLFLLESAKNRQTHTLEKVFHGQKKNIIRKILILCNKIFSRKSFVQLKN